LSTRRLDIRSIALTPPLYRKRSNFKPMVKGSIEFVSYMSKTLMAPRRMREFEAVYEFTSEIARSEKAGETYSKS
jgi:hypothetical protein